MSNTGNLVRLRACAGLLILTCACTSSSRGDTEAVASLHPSRAIVPVTLPNLSRADREVQQQIAEAYDAVDAMQRGGGATDPSAFADAYGRLGMLLLAAEFNDVATVCFLNAIHLSPDPRWTYYLAHAYKRMGDLANAAEYFERTAAIQPDNVAALWWLGVVDLDLGKPADAEAQFSHALALQPGALSAVYGLGQAALARNDYAKAVDLFERVLAMNPAATAAHYPLGLAYRGLGRLQEAEAHLGQRTHMEILPRDPLMNEVDAVLQSVTAYQDRGMRAAHSGNWAEAADQFRHAVEIAPDNIDARIDLSMALYRSGDPKGARTAAGEALRRAPKDRRVQTLVAELAASP